MPNRDESENAMKKIFVEEEDLLRDAYRLAVQIFEDGFRPDFIVGIWRGGSTVGIYVQECLQYLGLETDHIAIRTSYRGAESYAQTVDHPETIRVHGLQYLYEAMNHDDALLIVDDVFSTGQNVDAVIRRLQSKCNWYAMSCRIAFFVIGSPPYRHGWAAPSRRVSRP